MNRPEESLAEAQPEHPVYGIIIAVGSLAVGEVFALAGIEAIRNNAPEVVASSVIDGGFVLGSAVTAARELTKIFRSRRRARQQ